MNDMTCVPPPALPPASVESQVPRRVPMDITSAGVSPTQVQDRNQVATLPSPASGSQQMDTSRVGAASLTQVQNSTQELVQSSLSHTKNTTHRVGRHCPTASGAHVINANGHDTSWSARRTDAVSPGRRHGDKECRQQRRRFRRIRWFPIRFHIERWCVDRVWRTGARICLICAILSHIHGSSPWVGPRGRASTCRRRPCVLVAADCRWSSPWVGPRG